MNHNALNKDTWNLVGKENIKHKRNASMPQKLYISNTNNIAIGSTELVFNCSPLKQQECSLRGAVAQVSKLSLSKIFHALVTQWVNAGARNRIQKVMYKIFLAFPLSHLHCGHRTGSQSQQQFRNTAISSAKSRAKQIMSSTVLAVRAPLTAAPPTPLPLTELKQLCQQGQSPHNTAAAPPS